MGCGSGGVVAVSGLVSGVSAATAGQFRGRSRRSGCFSWRRGSRGGRLCRSLLSWCLLCWSLLGWGLSSRSSRGCGCLLWGLCRSGGIRRCSHRCGALHGGCRGRGGSAGGGGGLGARGGTFPRFPVVVAGGQSASDSDRGQGHSNKLTIKHDYVSLSPYQHTVNVRSPRACGRMGWSACRFAGCCAHQGIINKGEQHPRQCDGKYETPHGG